MPKDKRPGQGEENFHGRGDGQGDLLSALQRQGLGNQFAQDHVQAGDQDEGDHDGDAVGIKAGVRNLAEKLLHHVGEERFTHPAQGEAYYRDSQLDAVDYFVEVAVQFLDDAGADAAGFDELLDAGFADAHQGEFGRGKERVGCDQEQDQKHPEQHEGNHGWVILTFQRRYCIPTEATAL